MSPFNFLLQCTFSWSIITNKSIKPFRLSEVDSAVIRRQKWIAAFLQYPIYLTIVNLKKVVLKDVLSTLSFTVEETRFISWEHHKLHLATASTTRLHQFTCRRRRTCRTASSTASLLLTSKPEALQKLMLYHLRPCRILLALAALPAHGKTATSHYLHRRCSFR